MLSSAHRAEQCNAPVASVPAALTELGVVCSHLDISQNIQDRSPLLLSTDRLTIKEDKWAHVGVRLVRLFDTEPIFHGVDDLIASLAKREGDLLRDCHIRLKGTARLLP